MTPIIGRNGFGMTEIMEELGQKALLQRIRDEASCFCDECEIKTDRWFDPDARKTRLVVTLELPSSVDDEVFLRICHEVGNDLVEHNAILKHGELEPV